MAERLDRDAAGDTDEAWKTMVAASMERQRQVAEDAPNLYRTCPPSDWLPPKFDDVVVAAAAAVVATEQSRQICKER